MIHPAGSPGRYHAEHLPDVAGDEGADDPQENRDDEATGISARHEELRQNANDEPGNQRGQHAHVSTSARLADWGRGSPASVPSLTTS